MADTVSVDAALAQLAGWSRANDERPALFKGFVFPDFAAAWSFMSGAALKAEAMDHHPEWFNVYNRVDVTLTTHDAGGVTAKDIALAQVMDALARQLSSAK